MTGHPDTLRWFPLVARPRPACPPLNTRLDDIATTIRKARKTTGAEALALAAVALNKAALIASDSGLPDLAETLCLQQLMLYQEVQPLQTQTVRHALEPVVNLARLQIRAGRPGDAYQLLSELLTAAKERGTVTVASHRIDLAELMTADAHADTVRWLWTVLLADGSRALTSAGRWAEALDSVTNHTGIGERLLDGRQVAVIAHHHAGRPDAARDLLATARPAEGWERPVRQTLRMLCDPNLDVRCGDSALTAEQLRQAARGAELVVFRTRLALAAVDLTPNPINANTLLNVVHTDPAIYTDGYAARDVLAHPTSARLTASNRARLGKALAGAGLDNSIQRSQVGRLIDLSRASNSITLANYQEESSERQGAPVRLPASRR